ncbi:MAG: DNA cytosine methyltransferase [Chloroflexia bacterium]
MATPLRMITLFAGGGGLHLGLRKAGFDTVFASDFEPCAAATFTTNFPDVNFHLGDIRHLTPSLVADLTEGKPVDLIVGGPPCQGFSTLGDQIQGDPRNSLFEAFARVIRWVKPTCILMENTSYLRSQYAGRYEQEIRSTFTSLGYKVFVETLNAADFGAPQIRKRVFFFATRSSHEHKWPTPTYAPEPTNHLSRYRTVGESIMDIVDITTTGNLPNHIALAHSDKVIARYKLIPEGGRLPPPQQLPDSIRRRNFGNTYKRLHRERPSLTLVPGNNAFPIHPTEDRSLTPREAARLQGFPDSYIFSGNRAEQCKLVGNAVPVPVAEKLGEAIRDHLEGVDPSDDTEGSTHQVWQQLTLPMDFIQQGIDKERKAVPTRQLTAVSFFTGAGGLMLGFMRAGFKVVASYDIKSHIARNLELNFPEVPHYQSDVGQLSSQEVRTHTGLSSPDVVFGGPPCQGFSIFGKRRFVNTRGHRPDTDPRNELALKYIEIAVALSPKVIFLENVKGMLSTLRGEVLYLDEINYHLENRGYDVKYEIVNCAHYGIPQLRERLILIATQPGIEVSWPPAKYFENPRSWQRPFVTVGDVISDLADPSTYAPEFSHVPMNHKELLVERYKLIPQGGRLPEADLPEHLRQGYRSDYIKNYSHVYRRLAMDKPATTLVPGHNAFPVHPLLPRSLTVREAARIQTFPDYMKFMGTRQQQCTLVGNAVPPVLAEVFAQAIVKSIRGNALLPGYKADHYELKAGKVGNEYS